MYSSGRAAENSSLPAKRARLLRLAATQWTFVKGLLQLRFEHDTSTTRYNTLRGFSCTRIRDRIDMFIITRKHITPRRMLYRARIAIVIGPLVRLAAWPVDVDDGVANDVDSSAYYRSRELQSFQISLLVFSDL